MAESELSFRIDKVNCPSFDNDSTSSLKAETKDVYLSSEERYEVWLVKASERPELLRVNSDVLLAESTERNEWLGEQIDIQESISVHKEHKQDDCEGISDECDHSLPLTDGCDLEGWRMHQLVSAKGASEYNHDVSESYRESKELSMLLSVLNVGQGCALLRRERQIPLVSSRLLNSWNTLRLRLLEWNSTAHHPPPRLNYNAASLPLHPWFERDNTVVVLDGCTATWKAIETCRCDTLVQRFGHMQWRFSDTHGETMSLRTYQKYLESNEGQMDDAPLAVYDSQFGSDERCEILDEYEVPSCFDTDLFECLDKDVKSSELNDLPVRPPYRWILIGPARSGTGLHIDPVGTHAWVTLLQGLKRWVLFPPDTYPASIGMQTPQIPSVIWFRDYYDAIISNHPRAVHVLQYPGETVFVPAGWPHLVLNLELSVAITHNYATEYPSMQRLWNAIQKEEPEMASRLESKLRQYRPDLHTQLHLPPDEQELSC